MRKMPASSTRLTGKTVPLNFTVKPMCWTSSFALCTFSRACPGTEISATRDGCKGISKAGHRAAELRVQLVDGLSAPHSSFRAAHHRTHAPNRPSSPLILYQQRSSHVHELPNKAMPIGC